MEQRVPPDVRPILREMFRTQSLAALATSHDGQPYQSLIAFCASEDFKSILFATTRATRKFRNLTANPRAALLVDSRTGADSDFQNAAAVTAVGLVAELNDRARVTAMKEYLVRHPQLADFAAEPTTALLRLNVEEYFVVTQFQNVAEWSPG